MQAPALPRLGLRSRLLPTDVLAAVAAGFYLGLAYFARMRLNWMIADAVARQANALYVVASRDPHAAGIGFFWPPLASLLQLPVVAVLAPFGWTELAGPFSTALCGGLAVALIGRIARSFGAGRPVAFAIALAVAAMPHFVVYAISGMSEVPAILFGLLTFAAYARWMRTGEGGALAVAAFSLAGLAMIRLETLPVAAGLCVAALLTRRLRSSLTDAALLLLPAVAAMVTWMAVQLVILRDPLFFLHQDAGGVPGVNPPGTPDTVGHPIRAFYWAGAWLFAEAPFLVVATALIPVAVVRRQWARARATLGIALFVGLIGGLQAVQLARHQTFGESRYFMLAIPAGVVLALVWLPTGRRPLALAGRSLITVILLAGIATSWVGLRSPERAHMQREDLVLDALAGKRERIEQPTFDAFRDLAHDIDRRTRSGERVMAEAFANPAFVFSDHRARFIQPSDRDFERSLEDITRFANYAVTAGEAQAGFLNGRPDRVRAAVEGNPAWTIEKEYGRTATLWRNVAGRGSPEG